MKIEVEDLKKISLKPEDTLVIRANESLSSVLLRNTRKYFTEAFPNNKIIFISSKIEIYKIISEVE